MKITNTTNKSPRKRKTNPNSKTECYTKVSTAAKGWYSWDELHVPEIYCEVIGKELFHWATTNEDALKINDFLRDKKIFRDTAYYWRQKFPKFDAIYKEALLAIGDRREKLALLKKADGAIQMRTAHVYDEEWKEIDQYHKALKTAEEDKEREIHIHLGDVPKSEEVEKRLLEIKSDSYNVE